MTSAKGKSKTTNKNEDQTETQENTMTVREVELRDNIVKEAKKIALSKTSSAFDLVQATRELLKFEDSQKPA